MFVWICESGVRNCPWCARLMSLVRTYNACQCISKVKEPWSCTVTLANAILTSVINSRVVLIVSLICHDERVYKQIIPCKTSLSIKVNSLFLHKITGLVQNLPKATQQSPFYQEKIEPMGFFPSFSFYFHSSYVNKTNWRKCFQNSSSQNAAIQENLKPIKHMRGHIKSNIQLLTFLSKSHWKFLSLTSYHVH